MNESNNLNNIPAMEPIQSVPQATVQPVPTQPVPQAPVQPVPTQPVPQAPVQPVPMQPMPQAPVQPVPMQPMPQAPVQPVPVADVNPYGNAAIVNNQQSLQNIATVEQSNEQFINNTQTAPVVENKKNDNSISIAFVTIVILLIFVAVFFLFPILFERM